MPSINIEIPSGIHEVQPRKPRLNVAETEQQRSRWHHRWTHPVKFLIELIQPRNGMQNDASLDSPL